MSAEVHRDTTAFVAQHADARQQMPDHVVELCTQRSEEAGHRLLRHADTTRDVRLLTFAREPQRTVPGTVSVYPRCLAPAIMRCLVARQSRWRISARRCETCVFCCTTCSASRPITRGCMIVKSSRVICSMQFSKSPDASVRTNCFR